MSVRSVYLPQASIHDDRIRVQGEELHHLIVARVEPGETIEIFDGRGTVWSGSVESAGKREVVVKIAKSWQVPRESAELILGLAMIRIAAFELALEKAVEIGVTRIVPFTASRSNVVSGHRHERWMRIIIEAAKQSKRHWIPQLDEPKSFEEVLSLQAECRILFTERGGTPLKGIPGGASVLYLIGPEGGWDGAEMSDAAASGFRLISLGPSILKAETAAIVGGALILHELSVGS